MKHYGRGTLGEQVAKHAERCATGHGPYAQTVENMQKREEYQDFTTKDSGERVEYSTGMQRDTTTGKPRFDLITPANQTYTETMRYRSAMLMARGAEKYGGRNWEKASTQDELDRFLQSAERHFEQWVRGETDEDHAAAVIFNITGAEYVKGRI